MSGSLRDSAPLVEAKTPVNNTMDKSRTWDYLIIGQGLAGSLLGWTLLQRGRRVLIVDDGHRSSASMTAAGLVNPLAGLRFSRPPDIDRWLQAARTLYRELEVTFNRRYFYDVGMVRVFRSAEQIRFWEKRATDPASSPLLGQRFAPNASGHAIRADHGGFRQRQTGYLDVQALLSDLRRRFEEGGNWTQAAVHYAQFDPERGALKQPRHAARTIVFCEGYRLHENPWFDWLPLSPGRGEILTFSSGAALPDEIVNGAHWLIPLVDGRYRVGSTYDRHRIDAGTTNAGRIQILNGLSHLLGRKIPLELNAHRSGVRPGTRDRHPFLGRHANLPKIAVFNGFGAKGTLTIPWYTGRFADFLENGIPLPPEANIQRFSNATDCARASLS